MIRARSLAVAAIFAVAPALYAQSAFHWLNLENDKADMAIVRHALKNEKFTAIREVGVRENDALVMVTEREDGADDPESDSWSVINVSLKTEKYQRIVSGYKVQIQAWLGKNNEEIGISYFDCSECEAAQIFTALYWTPGLGWRARWPEQGASHEFPHPGIPLMSEDTSDDPENEEVAQVFALVPMPGDGYAAGYWLQVKNSASRKIVSNDVYRCFVDSSGKEGTGKLSGKEARDWERKICDSSNLLPGPNRGQDSALCKAALNPAKAGPTKSPEKSKN